MSDAEHVMTFRMPKSLAEEIQMVASVNGRPVSAEVREALIAAIEQRRQDPEFQTRLRRLVDENRVLLERLAGPAAALSPSTPPVEPSVDTWKAAETAAAQPGNEPRDLMAALRASVERAKAECTRPSGVGE